MARQVHLQVLPHAALRAPVPLPPSKSLSQRALVLQHGLPGLQVEGLSDAQDVQDLAAALHQLRQTAGLRSRRLWVGEGGTTLRFLLPLCALAEGETLLEGASSLARRPIGPLLQAVRSTGAVVLGETLPLRVQGRNPSTPLALEVDAQHSSQFASGWVMAAPLLPSGTVLQVHQPTSLPYLHMSLRLVEALSPQCWQPAGANRWQLVPNPNPLHTRFRPEADWSAAMFWVAWAAVLRSPVWLKGLGANSLQGDAVLLQWLSQFGLEAEWMEEGLQLNPSGSTSPTFAADLASSPDHFPALAALACCLYQQAHFTGLHSLPLKESNRLQGYFGVLQKAAPWMALEAGNDWARLSPRGAPVTPPEWPVALPSLNDHRVAMALSLLAAAPAWRGQGIHIQDPEVVAKSYPGYWSHLQAQAGFSVYLS